MAYLLGSHEKESILLVTFQYGDTPTYCRYTDWTHVVTHPISLEIFSPMVEMAVKLGKFTGFFSEPATTLTMLQDAFTLSISAAEPHADVFVTIEELTEDADETSQKLLTLFIGRIRKTVRGKGGKTKTVFISCENLKSRFDVPLGIVASNHCVYILGRKGCDTEGTSINIETLTKTGTVTDIEGDTITITGLPTVADRYWHRGHVRLDGLQILIREWVSGTVFKLALPPPAAWDGETVTLYPGCDKTVGTCIGTWNNEEHFCGAGYAMPPYHPVLETP